MGLCGPWQRWLPRGVAEAWLSGDVACAAEGATRFSTRIPSLITRSYAGACASHQPNHAGSCDEKIAPYQRSRQSLQKVLGREEQPLSTDDRVGNNHGKPLQTVCNDTGICKGFSQINVRLVEIQFYEKKMLQ